MARNICQSRWVAFSVGDFLKFLVTNYLEKVAQMFSDFWVIFKRQFFSKNWRRHFFGQLSKKLGYFYINIWSHWWLSFICSFGFDMLTAKSWDEKETLVMMTTNTLTRSRVLKEVLNFWATFDKLGYFSFQNLVSLQLQPYNIQAGLALT